MSLIYFYADKNVSKILPLAVFTNDIEQWGAGKSLEKQELIVLSWGGDFSNLWLAEGQVWNL